MYARIDLSKTNYTKMDSYKFITTPNIYELNTIYKQYCTYKKFKSVMPIFDSEYTDSSNQVIGYYDGDILIAFSLIKIYDTENVEAIQFAWNYEKPKLRLGIRSLENECAIYKSMGFKYLYLGGADEYKSNIDGFEVLGPLVSP